MSEYHKIQTVFLRDPDTKFKTLLDGQYALPEFEYLAANNWIFTEKVDGTNIRIYIDGEGNATFGGRTDRAQIPATLIERLQAITADKDNLANKFPDGAILYGEGYGAKIQKGGGNYREDQSFVLFDVRVGDWWLERDAVVDVAAAIGIEVVPSIGAGPLSDALDMCRVGFHSSWGDFAAEGIVARPEVGLCNRSGKRVITKIKCKDFAEVGQ